MTVTVRIEINIENNRNSYNYNMVHIVTHSRKYTFTDLVCLFQNFISLGNSRIVNGMF